MKSIINNRFLLGILLIISSCASTPPATLPSNNNFILGETCFLGGKFQEALTHYQQFLNEQPRSDYKPYTLCQMGLCALALSETDKALEYFLQALPRAKEPSLNARVLIGLGNASSARDEYAQAAAYYLRALKETQSELANEASVLFHLATALFRAGDWAGGKKYLSKLRGLKSAPEHLIEAAQTRLALPEGIFVVQLGKYQNKDNALQYLTELKEEKNIVAELKVLLINGDTYYFIWAGSSPDWRSAQKQAEELQTKGIEAIVIP